MVIGKVVKKGVHCDGNCGRMGDVPGKKNSGVHQALIRERKRAKQRKCWEKVKEKVAH